MASIKFGGGVADMRGSQGGTVYSRNASGAYTRNRTMPINPNSQLQQATRNAFGNIATAWRGLTEAEQATWIEQAPAYPYLNRLGESSVYTGFQLYQKVNSQLQLCGQAGVDTIIAPVEMPITTSFEFDTFSTTELILNAENSFTNTNEVPSDLIFVYEATMPLSTGVYRPKRQDFKQVQVIPPTDVTALDNVAGYTNAFGYYPVVGQKIFVRGFFVSLLTGQTNNPIMRFSTMV